MELTIINPKLRLLLQEKDALVKEGRKSSAKLEIIERKLEANKEKQRKYTGELEPEDLIKKGKELEKRIEADLTSLEKLQKEVHALKIANIPAGVANEYESLKKEKEEAELGRNKIALKVQKIKDRSIPIIQKEVKPHLKEYEDIESAELKGEKIVVKVFSYLEQWKEKFNAKNS